MSAILSSKGDLLVCPGDLIDKITIITIKKLKLGSTPALEKEEQLVSELFNNIREDVDSINIPELFNLLKELQLINCEQWDAEDRVRNENSWEAAQEARRLNTKRVCIKNKINKLFGYPTEEKLYKSSETNESENQEIQE